ncbi:MAG: DUF4294 domain-containing protein [Saprospiraceae bacterium]
MKKEFLLLVMTFFALSAFAQETVLSFQKVVDGKVLEGKINTNGDTTYSEQIEMVFVVHKRKFRSKKERLHYHYTATNANIVYPYAVQVIKTLRELEATTKDLKKRNRKKHIKELQDELEEEFKAQLKTLTQSQSKILIAMIEREMEEPLYNLVKDWKGGFSATYWCTLAKMYDVDIKEGYHAEDDPILEIILKSRDVSHDIAVN